MAAVCWVRSGPCTVSPKGNVPGESVYNNLGDETVREKEKDQKRTIAVFESTFKQYGGTQPNLQLWICVKVDQENWAEYVSLLHLSPWCLLPSPCTHNRLLCARPSECCEMAGQWDSCVVRTGGLLGEEGCGSQDGGSRGGERKAKGKT